MKLDSMSDDEARAALTRCCGSSRWVEAMLARRPFGTSAALYEAADEVWASVERADVLEAFEHHPRIGANLDALREKFAPTKGWSAGEQSSVAVADDATLEALRDGNVDYEKRFGHIFIVCATGKSATEMLGLLKERLDNEPDVELRIAAGEQAKITRIRLDKLLEQLASTRSVIE